MTEEKKSKNPFIAAAMSAKANKLPAATTVKNQKSKNQVQINKPTKRTAGRGR
jgi:hypothetical protein